MVILSITMYLFIERTKREGGRVGERNKRGRESLYIYIYIYKAAHIRGNI
jgi:hypothetical protein